MSYAQNSLTYSLIQNMQRQIQRTQHIALRDVLLLMCASRWIRSRHSINDHATKRRRIRKLSYDGIVIEL
jgi:hypothetical protein